MHQESRRWTSVAIGLIVALLPGAVPRTWAEDARITVGTQREALVPFHLAVDTGLFAAAGLEVREVPHESGTATLQPLLEGRIDIAYMTLAPAVVFWIRGVPVEVILLSHVSASERLVVRPGSGVVTLADLRGKRIAVAKATTAAVALARALERAGLSSRDLTIVHMTGAEVPRAFAAGRIDGAWVWEPTSGALNDQGGVTIATSGAVLGIPSVGVWLARPEFVRAHPEAIARFLSAMDRGVAAYGADPPRALAGTARRLGRTPEAVAAYIRRTDVRFLRLADQGTSALLGLPKPGEETPMVELAKRLTVELQALGVVREPPADWSGFVNEAPLRAYLDRRGE